MASQKKLMEIAEKLSESRYRFLTDMQIGSLRRQYKATRDEIRTAAIMADRMRRARQRLGEGECFKVVDVVDIEAPIKLREQPAWHV